MLNHCVLAVGTRENNKAHDLRNKLEKRFLKQGKRPKKQPTEQQKQNSKSV